MLKSSASVTDYEISHQTQLKKQFYAYNLSYVLQP